MLTTSQGIPTIFSLIYGATPRYIEDTQGHSRQNHGPPPPVRGITQLFYSPVEKHPSITRPRIRHLYPLVQYLPWTASISFTVRPISQWFSFTAHVFLIAQRLHPHFNFHLKPFISQSIEFQSVSESTISFQTTFNHQHGKPMPFWTVGHFEIFIFISTRLQKINALTILNFSMGGSSHLYLNFHFHFQNVIFNVDFHFSFLYLFSFWVFQGACSGFLGEAAGVLILWEPGYTGILMGGVFRRPHAVRTRGRP